MLARRARRFIHQGLRIGNDRLQILEQSVPVAIGVNACARHIGARPAFYNDTHFILLKKEIFRPPYAVTSRYGEQDWFDWI
jgi:hypothetical protein